MILLKNFLMAMAMVWFVAGCGGGGVGGLDAKSVALTKIADYAVKGEKAPTVQDYIDAGVTGVTADNLEAVNTAVRAQDQDGVDSVEKIQAIVDSVVSHVEDDADEGGDDGDDGDNTSDPNLADTTKPVITLNGAATVNLTVGETYTDAGATATDDTDGDITAQIVVNNPVNTSTAGTYYVTYNVQDAAGNHAVEVRRTVNVQPQPPVSMTLTITTTCTTEDGNDCTLTAESNETISDVRWSGDGVDGVSGNPLTVTSGYDENDHSVDVNVSDERGYRHTAHLDFHINPLGAVSLTLDINVSGWLRPSSDENGTRDIKFAGESNDTAHIASWSWDLGDGLSASDQNATRRYTAVGNYTVTITVTDTNDFDHTATADVNITAYNTVERWIKSHNGTAKFEYEADFGDVTSTTGGSTFEDDGAGKLVPSSTPCYFQRNENGDMRTSTIGISSILGHFCLTWTPDNEHYVIVDYKENDDPNPYYPFLHHDDGTGYGTLPYDERRIYTVEEHRINQVSAGAEDVDGNKHDLLGMDNNTSLYLYIE
jgi:hypothetical protein